ncbi:MAG: HK97 gp10 family phage protein, partial [Lactococcus sp.]
MIMGVEIRGMDRLRRKVNALPQILNTAMEGATNEITELVRAAAELKISSSMKAGTGELLGSIKTEVVTDYGGKLVGRVWSDKEQAIYREFGTGPNGEASPKDLPEGIHPVYTQTRWFIPAEAVAIDLSAVYGMPK